MKNVERIIDHSPEIEALQERMLEETRAALPHAEVEAIGSMAVPLSGKEELDFMAISKDVPGDSLKLVEVGYKQGPVDKDISYLKKMVEGIEVATQVIPEGHKMIGIHRMILEKLRNNPDLRTGYEELKRSLVGSDIRAYRAAKKEWITKNLLANE